MNTAVRRKLPHHMTVDEFIAWVGDDRWQLVDGEPRAMAPANATHGIIQARLAYPVTGNSRRRAGSCVVVTEPAIHPRVRARSNMRVPDLAVTCSSVEAGQIALPDPLLIVEILSPTKTNPIPGRMSGHVSCVDDPKRPGGAGAPFGVDRRRPAARYARTAPGPTSRSRSVAAKCASGVYRPDRPLADSNTSMDRPIIGRSA